MFTLRTVVIAELSDIEGILGLDYLEDNKAVIDLWRDVFTLEMGILASSGECKRIRFYVLCYLPTLTMLLVMWSQCWETFWHRVMLFVLLSYPCHTRVLLGIARSVVFIIPRLLLYFALDSCTKFDFQIVIYRW